jgi:uncharacterized protein YyaL (SSP411 family)
VNRLNNSTSPYLLQHADNPVDWYPWSEEALTQAKVEDKPIFLSVGYAACHWCHVMAHESFEDPDTADIMNQYFINIKVDREERPDIDSLYMDAVVALTGQGGWPMSVFMSPDGKPFYGGTYFPPVPRYNMPSFKDLLAEISRMWREDRENLLSRADQLTDHINKPPALVPVSGGVNENSLTGAAEALFNRFDWTHAGWGNAPKFPQSPVIDFLFRLHDRNEDKLALDMAAKTLHAMARGGMYDLIGGGFHRYSVDDQWLVPHFEKMLYDNALLIKTYLQGWQISKEPLFKEIAQETLKFLKRELRDAQGGYYSSLDADSEGEEGTYYIWSEDEISEALNDTDLTDLIKTAFGITPAGNFEGKNIPRWNLEMDQLAEIKDLPQDVIRGEIEKARDLLLESRSSRIRPGLDDKVLTSWNGLVLTALCTAARVLDEDDYLEDAQSLASFLLEEMLVDGKLLRSWRDGKANFAAYLEDHAALGLGLLELYQIDFNLRWYLAAVTQAEEILDNFQDTQGGFFDTRHDHERLIARPKSLQDSPIPSGNSMAAALLLKLGALTGDSRFIDPAEAAIDAMQSNAAKYPTAFGNWLCAADFSLGPQLQLAVMGDIQDAGFGKMIEVIHKRYLPRIVLAAADPSMEGIPGLLVDRDQIEGKATAYLCQAFACKLPTTSPEELARQIEEARSS